MEDVAPEHAARGRALGAFLASTIPDTNRHEVSALELAYLIEDRLHLHSLFEGVETIEKRIPQITVFTYSCAPRGALRDGLVTAAEFLFVFFLLNDHWDTCSGELDVADTRMGAQRSFASMWSQDLGERYGHASRRFSSSFRDYQEALLRERQWGSPLFPATFENYVDKQEGRYQWVATSPYIDLWELTMAIELSEDMRRTTEPLKELAVELTYIANDIGSLVRDPGDKNYVRLLADSAPGPMTIGDAAMEAHTHYSKKIGALSDGWGNISCPQQLRYVSMLADIVDGNLDATLALSRSGVAGRYAPDHQSALAKLPKVNHFRPDRQRS